MWIGKVVMPPGRQADHYGRDERITYLPRDVMREAIHTPVGLPPTVEGGDGYALQEVQLIKCTSESPHSYALILRFAHRGGGKENFQPCDDSIDTIPTPDRQCINVTLQIARDQTDQMSGARLQLADSTFKIFVHPRTAPRILATASLRNASSRNASCSNSRLTSSGTSGVRSARPIRSQRSGESVSCSRKRAAIWIALRSAAGWVATRISNSASCRRFWSNGILSPTFSCSNTSSNRSPNQWICS